METRTAVLPGDTEVLHSRGHEVTTDTLLLGLWASPAPAGRVCELGSGSAVASVVAAKGRPKSSWLCIDMDVGQLRLARANFLGVPNSGFHAVCCDVAGVPSAFPEGIADLVLMNPPYLEADRGRRSPKAGRDRSRRGDGLTMAMFVRAASHLLSSGGELQAVIRPDSLPRLLRALGAYGLSAGRLQPVGRQSSPASLLLVGAASSVGSLALLPQVDAPVLQQMLLDGDGSRVP